MARVQPLNEPLGIKIPTTVTPLKITENLFIRITGVFLWRAGMNGSNLSSTCDIILYEGGKYSAEKRSNFQKRRFTGSVVQFKARNKAYQQHYV